MDEQGAPGSEVLVARHEGTCSLHLSSALSNEWLIEAIHAPDDVHRASAQPVDHAPPQPHRLLVARVVARVRCQPALLVAAEITQVVGRSPPRPVGRGPAVYIEHVLELEIPVEGPVTDLGLRDRICLQRLLARSVTGVQAELLLDAARVFRWRRLTAWHRGRCGWRRRIGRVSGTEVRWKARAEGTNDRRQERQSPERHQYAPASGGLRHHERLGPNPRSVNTDPPEPAHRPWR